MIKIKDLSELSYEVERYAESYPYALFIHVNWSFPKDVFEAFAFDIHLRPYSRKMITFLHVAENYDIDIPPYYELYKSGEKIAELREEEEEGLLNWFTLEDFIKTHIKSNPARLKVG